METPSEKITKGHSLWRDAWTRLCKNKAAVTSAVFLLLVAGICIIGPLFPSLKDPNLYNLETQNQWPAKGNWFGTDHLGRDLFARVLFGGRISLTVALVTAAVSLTIGVTWGAISGYAGGWVDTLMMRIVDILYALPFLVIVILLQQKLAGNTSDFLDWVIKGLLPIFKDETKLRTTIGPIVTMVPLFIAIGALSWLNLARIVRASVQSVARQEFVEAARSLGLGPIRILGRHILPNVLGPIIVFTTLTIPSIMLFEATLSFLGLGIQPPNASWGVLIKEGADRMTANPQLLIFPSIFFVLTLLSLNFLGDGLRDALDPKAAKD